MEAQAFAKMTNLGDAVLILVTGAGGFIGRKITQLAQLDTDAALFSGRKLTNGFVITPIEAKECDSAILLGGVVNFSKINEDVGTAFRINTYELYQTIDSLKEAGIFIVFISSESVFSGRKSLYEETDKPDPIFHYGAMKASVESYLRENVPSDRFSIIRLAKVFDTSANEASLFSEYLGWLGKKSDYPLYEDLYTKPVDRDYAAKFILEVAKKKISGVYHVAGEKSYSRSSIAMSINSKLQEIGLDQLRIDYTTARASFDPRVATLPRRTLLQCKTSRHILQDRPVDLVELVIKCAKAINL